jgi:hypothetical protein
MQGISLLHFEQGFPHQKKSTRRDIPPVVSATLKKPSIRKQMGARVFGLSMREQQTTQLAFLQAWFSKLCCLPPRYPRLRFLRKHWVAWVNSINWVAVPHMAKSFFDFFEKKAKKGVWRFDSGWPAFLVYGHAREHLVGAFLV